MYIIKIGNEIHVSGCLQMDKPFIGQKQNGLFFFAYVGKWGELCFYAFFSIKLKEHYIYFLVPC